MVENPEIEAALDKLEDALSQGGKKPQGFILLLRGSQQNSIELRTNLHPASAVSIMKDAVIATTEQLENIPPGAN